ncbi:hypothetical protein ACO2Q8_29030 [Larkinella sp. VNQ87]|uniref:hypothetical protein n=1 Tax=Larkinella sp. VNQ87 TaxID=3400921 RepID=UPI003C018A61
MRNFTHWLYTLTVSLFLLVGMTSCELVGDIFKAGLWVYGIGIFLVVVVAIWLFRKVFGGRS